MLDINFFKENEFFEHMLIKKGEIIFNSGDYDNYLYIILSGEVSVEKYTTSKRQEMKKLASLKEGGLFGEASVTSFLPKEVKIQALEDTFVIKIEAKQGVRKLINKFPVKGLELLKYIIALTNKRLLLANEQIIANYEMNKTILEIDKIDNKSIFFLIEKFKYIIGCDYILYFKSSPFIDNFTTLVYDTRKKGIIYGDPIELKGGDLKINNIDNLSLSKYNLINKLNIGHKNLGYIVFGNNDKSFLENDRKNISSIITGLSGIINQKSFLDEERDKIFLKSEE